MKFMRPTPSPFFSMSWTTLINDDFIHFLHLVFSKNALFAIASFLISCKRNIEPQKPGKPSGGISAISFVLLTAFALVSITGCENKKSSQVETEKITTGIIIGIVTQSNVTNTNCPSSITTYTSISATLKSQCGSCHNGSNQSANLDVTSYSSISKKVSSGSPASSTLYIAVSSGSMAKYSDSTLNSSIYCWIKSGASN